VTRSPAAPPSDDGPRPASARAAEYFELLLEGAGAIEYERPVVRARAAGAEPAELAELERVKLLALEVREAFAARRRRESELSALFDTANDLAALRGVDSVLTAIVRRARQLLGSDVSYLTLNDPTKRDTYMRVTDGSVSARFQALRLPMGAGLGGLVAQTAAPYATASYFTDARFRHTDQINDGVRDEGLVAILGVPLIRGSQVIGVLFAADRSERTFDRAQVSLLGTRRSPWTTPGSSRRPGPHSTSCRRPAGSCAPTRPRSSGRPAPTTGSSRSSCAAVGSRTSRPR
jgi:hypothetical protein